MADISPMGTDFPSIDNESTRRGNHRSMTNLVHAIRNLMAEAQNAQSHRAHTPVGMQEPTLYIPMSAARSMLACLSGDSLVGLFDSEGRLRRTPNAAPSSDEVKLDAALIANSRVANAGAHVLIYPDAGKIHAVGKSGAIAIETIPGAVRNVEAAKFGTVNVAAEENVTVIPRPIHSADIDWTQSIAKGVRFEVPRSDRRKYMDPDKLAGEIITSLILGLSRAADEVLLSAIAATTPGTFSFAQAAAQDVRFGELRALVGTAGAGAQVNQSGSLRVDGVPADLTPDMAGTIVGAFNRATIGIKDDITILFERTGTAGALAVTAWASMLPLVPDSNKFWTAA